MKIVDQLYTADCVEKLKDVPAESVDLAFCDPPYNIGFDYGEGEINDNMKPDEYRGFSIAWISQVGRVLRPNGSFWLAIGDEWAAELKVVCNSLGFHLRSWIIWYYTFGVNSPQKFTRSHAHLLYFTKHKKNFVFNAEAIRVPSSRALVYNDKRANPEGRLPDDTWIIRPQDLPDGFPPHGDVWFIPRICGTFKRRQEGAANQMPEQLLGRVIRACSAPGDLVLDPMAGTGTTLAVAKKLGRHYLGFELSENFSGKIKSRLKTAKVGDTLDGPIEGA